MPRISHLQTNFTAGEFSERLRGRTDIDRYGNAARSLTNAYPVVQGGARRRPGTRFVKATKFSGTRSRLIPFVFSRDAAYMLELGESYVRVFKAGGVDLGVEIASPYTAAQLPDVDYAQGADTMFLAHPSVPMQRLRRFSDAIWDLSAAPFDPPPFDGTGHHIVAAAHWTDTSVGLARTLYTAVAEAPFYPSDVGRGVSSATGMGTVSGFMDAAHVLVDITAVFPSSSMAPGTWKLTGSPMAFVTPSSDAIEGSTVTLYSALTREAGNVTLSALTGPIDIVSDYACFVSADVGRTLWTGGSRATITAFVDTYHLQANVVPDKPFLSLKLEPNSWGLTSPAWRAEDVGRHVALNNGLYRITGFFAAEAVAAIVVRKPDNVYTVSPGAWSLEGAVWNSYDGYPRTVTIHEQRLVAAGSPGYPQTIWGSETGAYLSFTKGTADADACTFTIASDEVNPIAYVTSQRNLIAYTYGGEFSIQGGVEKALAPTNVRIRPESSYGAARVRPVQVAKESVFVQRAGRKVRASGYDYSRDGYVSPDITVMAEHITDGGVVSMAYQQEPDMLLWAARADGALLSCTLDREQGMVAWAKHYTDGAVESVASIPNGDRDEVWLVVRRTVNGSTVRYLEILDDTFQPALPGAAYTGFPPAPVPVTYGYTVDCGKAFDNASGQTVFAVPHLIGKTVDIVADGAVQPAQVVPSSGNVTIARASYRTLIGLHFRSEIGLLTPEIGTGTGTAQGNSMRVSEVTVRMLNTIGAEIYDGDGDLVDELSLRQFGASVFGQAPQPFSGIKRAEQLGWERGRAELTIVQDQPLPMHVLSVVRKLTVND